VFGVTAALAALRERDATGQGQRVTSALFESAAFLVASHMGSYAATGTEPPPMPARRGAWGIYDVFDCAGEGKLFIGVTSDQQWGRFTEAFALQALAADERLNTNAKRSGERSWLIPALQEVMRALPQAEVAARCEACGVSWAPVNKPRDMFEDAHLLASGGLLQTLVAGQLHGLPNTPMAFDGARATLHRQPPGLGEHGDEVLAEAGYSAAEIAALRAEGAVVSHAA
jgi:crotonobetainyl-CoA:carnitine CoA-transferase CaiB-like acyl-CoA transferase